MCGRFTEILPGEILAKRFNAKWKIADWDPNYNASPRQKLPIILDSNPHEIITAQWGIVPDWLHDKARSRMLVNARAESLMKKPTFAASFRDRRCLVLADGFYEWRLASGGRIPYRIVRKDREPFAFAGIWKNIEGVGPSFVIITVPPNAFMEQIHDRMPAILLPEGEGIWLSSDEKVETVHRLLKPYPQELLMAYPVSRLVNNPANNIPAVIEQISKSL